MDAGQYGECSDDEDPSFESLFHLVLRSRHSHQPFVEPADDVVEPFDTVPWLSGARELMALSGKSDHYGRNVPIF